MVSLVPDRVRDQALQGIRAAAPLEVELPEGSTLADVVDYFALPHGKVRVIFVNGRVRPLDHVLVSGDEVGIFPPIGGG